MLGHQSSSALRVFLYGWRHFSLFEIVYRKLTWSGCLSGWWCQCVAAGPDSLHPLTCTGPGILGWKRGIEGPNCSSKVASGVSNESKQSEKSCLDTVELFRVPKPIRRLNNRTALKYRAHQCPYTTLLVYGVMWNLDQSDHKSHKRWSSRRFML